MKLPNWVQKYPQAILFILTLLIYANTLTNEYALDDAIVITENNFVKQGLEGIDDILSTESFTGFFGFDKQLVAGGRYRPLSIATFALEHEFFGQNPFISHLINILLYAFVVVLIFQVLQKSSRVATEAAFIIALLYALHPIHTEAIANTKGRDEILAFLFVLLAAKWLFYSKKNKLLVYTAAAISMFLAMLSKEHAVVFVVLLPLGLYYLKRTKAQIVHIIFVTLIPAALFVFLRYQVLGGMQIQESSALMNNPFVDMTTGEKFATILLTWLWYLRLLIVPHPLTYDYYPYHVPITGWDSIYPWLTLIIVIALLFFAVKTLINRKFYGFWVWFFIGTFILMSNLFFPIGTFMNERFMFMPSLAFSVALGYGIHWLLKQKTYTRAGFAVLIIVGLAYSVKAIDRNRDWKNDFTLFTHDVQISENSAKGNCVAGGQLYEKAIEQSNTSQKQDLLQLARKYLEKAIDIHPTYNDAHLLYGNTLFASDEPLKEVMPHYLSILNRAPRHQSAWKNALAVLQKGKPKNRLQWYKKLNSIDSTRFEINYQMGNIYGKHLNDLKKAEKYLKRAIQIKPGSIKALKDLAVVYGLTRRYKASVSQLRKVVKLKPEDASAWYNLGLSLNAMGQIDEAQKALDKAHELNPEQKRVVIRK